ncbi:ABC transporter permease subunit [Granulicatella sp. 19428wC4_WM01]|nr:ABC transporter permease subunit [Granulicatella sp. 19428wC4_WM01]MBF0779541.1 ABC transporter permease subunit [Granulicatella sp. 19428wC4_WM01]
MLLLCVCFAPLIAPHDPYYVDVSRKMMPPSATHWLGTDNLGRDVFSRLIYGAQFSILLAVIISVLEIIIGSVIGIVVGWYGKKVERSFLWITNIISAFPSFLLAIAIAGVLGQGTNNLIVSIVVIEWIYYAKIVVSLVKTHKHAPHAIVAKTLGYSRTYIMVHHILPFIYKPILTLVLMNVGSIVLMISGFSFLGIGVQPSLAEWGMMLHDAKNFFRTHMLLMAYPSLAILCTVVSFNVLGEELQGRE